MREKNFNLIGFNFNSSDPYIPSKTCVIHYGTPLISKRDEPGVLWCPECGMRYSEKDTGTDEAMKGKFKGPNQKSQIISAKKKKKYYDKQGNIINDPDLIADIERGATVISYHEEKHGEEKRHHIVRK
jgi:hypothetical protein